MDNNLTHYEIIPGYEFYGISEHGEVIEFETMEKVNVQKGEYLRVSIGKENPGIHILVATTFHGKRPENGIANHKDGDKHNNHKDNVEWVTYSGNITHAYKNGLRTDNRPIIAWDIELDSKTEFYSMAECARFFGVSTERIWRNVRATDNIYFSKYVLRFANDDRDWPAYTKANIGQHVNGTAKDVKATCLESGTVYIASSISQMARELNLKMGTVAFALNKSKSGKSGGYRFDYL